MATPPDRSSAPPPRPEINRILHEAISRLPAERASNVRGASAGGAQSQQEVAFRLADTTDGGQAAETPAFGPGTEVGAGRYEVLEPVGQGGMGRVYKALDRQLDRIVAIKAIRPELVSDPDTARRLAREARLAASLDHPFICEIHELLRPADGQTLLVMEYVDGQTLKETLEKGPIPPERVVRCAREIAEALSVAHDRGLVHRDIKPANIMLTPHGHVKVMDFGIAKARCRPEATTTSTLTGPGHVVGTPAYMSPEQAAGLEVDPRSDVFSFGVLLYECLAGQPPFDPVPHPAFLRWLHGPRPKALPRHVPSELRALVSRCVERKPEDRFQDFSEVRAALDTPTLSRFTATGTNTFPAVDPWNWRSWVWLAALAVAVAAGVLAVDRFRMGRTQGGGLMGQGPVMTWPTTELCSRISPDGTALTFLSNRGGEWRLWVGSVDGSDPRPIAGPQDALKTPAWSPDGRSIAFLFRSTGQAWLQIATVWGEVQGSPKLLPGTWDDVALVRWIGTHLYFSVSSGSSASVLWCYDTGNGTRRQVTHPDDGRRFTTSGSTVNVDVRRDERRVVFVPASAADGRLAIADLDGRNAEVIPLDASLMVTPRWRGADGRHIVFVSNENGQPDIWDYDLQARSRTPLTTSPLPEDSVDVSAAGDVIVADTLELTSHLWAVRPDSAEAPRQLTNDRSDIWPGVAARSGRVIFHRTKRSFVADTPTDTDLLTARWADGRLTVERVVGVGASGGISADGRRVFFLRWPTTGPGDRRRPPELWVQDLDVPGPPVRLSDGFWFPGNHIATWAAIGQTAAWAPQGADELYFVRRTTVGSSRCELLRATLDSELVATTRVLATTAADGDERISDIAVSEDGTTVVYVAASRKTFQGGRLLRLDVGPPAGAPQVIFETAAGTQLYVAGWTRRGTVIVVVSSSPEQGDVSEVFEIDRDGRGAARRLASEAGVLGMTAQLDPTRDRLYATAVKGGVATVCALSLPDGKRATVVDNILDGITFAGYTVMPDGWLLYSLKETSCNVWLFDFRTGSVPRASQGGW